MKIFITGGTGFVGRSLVKQLSNTDHELVCLARKTSDLEPLKDNGVEIVFGDLTDKVSLKQGMRGCDRVINVAGNFEMWLADQHGYHDVNVAGVVNIMEAVLEEGIEKVVHISTIAAFGETALPITEESQYGEECASEYARTKRMGEMIAWKMYEEQGLPLVVVYPAAVIGPNDPKAAGRYIQKIARHQMPAQVLVDAPFCFIYVEDLCRAIIQALLKEDNIGERYLVSGANMTWGELNQLICDLADVSLPFIKLPDAVTVASSRLLTAIADLIKVPPLLDLSKDQVDLMKEGFRVDAGKCERELGIRYTPMRTAMEKTIASFV